MAAPDGHRYRTDQKTVSARRQILRRSKRTSLTHSHAIAGARVRGSTRSRPLPTVGAVLIAPSTRALRLLGSPNSRPNRLTRMTWKIALLACLGLVAGGCGDSNPSTGSAAPAETQLPDTSAGDPMRIRTYPSGLQIYSGETGAMTLYVNCAVPNEDVNPCMTSVRQECDGKRMMGWTVEGDAAQKTLDWSRDLMIGMTVRTAHTVDVEDPLREREFDELECTLGEAMSGLVFMHLARPERLVEGLKPFKQLTPAEYASRTAYGHVR